MTSETEPYFDPLPTEDKESKDISHFRFPSLNAASVINVHTPAPPCIHRKWKCQKCGYNGANNI